MNVVGLYGGSGFIGAHFQKTLKKISNNNSQIHLLPHRGSPEEIKTALREFDALSLESTQASILYLAENNEIAQAGKLSSDYSKLNTKRLRFILSNTDSRIIYASSVGVYGDLSELPHHPSGSVNPLNSYAHSKLDCEKLVLQAGGIVARLSNIYGQGMSKKNIISDVLKQITAKGVDSINIINGTPIRDMIHISDVISCLLAMTTNPKKGVYNVATGIDVSMKDLVMTILEAAKLEDCNLMESNQSKATSCISLDISKTKEVFEWSPCIKLKDGLKELI
jgi:nucleoside-diphosphate-sugar epimerase